jgi:hypothetical protein
MQHNKKVAEGLRGDDKQQGDLQNRKQAPGLPEGLRRKRKESLDQARGRDPRDDFPEGDESKWG